MNRYRERYLFAGHIRDEKKPIIFNDSIDRCDCKDCAKIRRQSPKTRVRKYLRKLKENTNASA